jgi:trehalose 6-phosphate phosphatase
MEPLAALAAEPGAAALVFDVDGTLAPIVDDPADALVPETTRAELRRLAARYGLVACVSGRPEDRARAIVGVPELAYVGEHGLGLDPDAGKWADAVRRFVDGTHRPAERKSYSAAFHFRTADDEDAARAELAQVAAAAEALGLRTRWGRQVLEVLPPVDASKRTAVERLLAQAKLRRALYAGDDTTDLDAFAALERLELGVRVAVASAEAPTALLEQADVVVESPVALVRVLAEL